MDGGVEGGGAVGEEGDRDVAQVRVADRACHAAVGDDAADDEAGDAEFVENELEPRLVEGGVGDLFDGGGGGAKLIRRAGKRRGRGTGVASQGGGR